MACIVKDKTSTAVTKALADVWTKHYQIPELLSTDQGPELIGKRFTIYVASQTRLQHFMDSESHGNKVELCVQVVV